MLKAETQPISQEGTFSIYIGGMLISPLSLFSHATTCHKKDLNRLVIRAYKKYSPLGCFTLLLLL